MDNLYRREFLLKVLLTIGTQSLVDISNMSANVIAEKCLGQCEITDLEIEQIYQALTAVA